MQAVGPVRARQGLIGPCEQLSLRRQCELLEISRSGYYYEPVPESLENLEWMRRLDQLHMAYPVYGSRRLRVLLQREGREVNRKRITRLLGVMGVQALYPKGSLSRAAEGHRIYPYLLEGLEISGPDQVWCSDITYVPMARGFLYLVALMDWWSRYVLAWELSNSLDSEFCVRAWTNALATGRQPLISNTDQGSQFTSEAYLEAVEAAGVDVRAWTAGVGGSTTGSSSDCGAASSRRTFTCRTTPTDGTRTGDWPDGLGITTRCDPIRRWATPRPPRCTTRPNPMAPNPRPGDGDRGRDGLRVHPSVRPLDPDGSKGLTPGWTRQPRKV